MSDDMKSSSMYVNESFNVYESNGMCSGKANITIVIPFNVCEKTFTLQSNNKAYSFPILLTSPLNSYPTLSPVINPTGQWITGLYYSKPNCQGNVLSVANLKEK